MSFVRTKSDVLKVKHILHEKKKNIPIVSKIEKPQAVDNIDEILEATDVIMVARGDMGVELGNHLVPSTQKMIIHKCNTAGIPVITATQMLESMITNSTPTRAEASDVANAIWDGTDAVMLSAETASGKYPVRAVEMMVKIIKEAEKIPKGRESLRDMDLSGSLDALMVSASMVAEKIHAKKIVAVTESGFSCLKLAKFRPRTEVLGVTKSPQVVRMMCLLWGIRPFIYQEYDSQDPQIERDILGQVREEYGLVAGDKIVITGGDGKFFVKGSSNQLKVEVLRRTAEEIENSHPSETVETGRGSISIDTKKCVPCGKMCVEACPHNIWSVVEERPPRTYLKKREAKSCAFDMECVRVCPTDAITIIPK